jgi:hypothetical protein
MEGAKRWQCEYYLYGEHNHLVSQYAAFDNDGLDLLPLFHFASTVLNITYTINYVLL